MFVHEYSMTSCGNRNPPNKSHVAEVGNPWCESRFCWFDSKIPTLILLFPWVNQIKKSSFTVDFLKPFPPHNMITFFIIVWATINVLFVTQKKRILIE